MRYPAVKWFFLPGRDAAEAWTFRTLERFWNLFHGRVPALDACEAGGKLVIGDPKELGPRCDGEPEIFAPSGFSLVALELD